MLFECPHPCFQFFTQLYHQFIAQYALNPFCSAKLVVVVVWWWWWGDAARRRMPLLVGVAKKFSFCENLFR